MTYAVQEQSVQDGAPVLLYLFEQGGSSWRLTNYPIALVWSAQSWLPAAIVSPRFEQASEMAKNSITVKLPSDHSLAATFLGGSPDAKTSVTIWRAHLTDLAGETLVVWKGHVVNSSAGGRGVSLECNSIFAASQKLGVGRTYQRTCPHALFGAGCQLDASDYANAVTVIGVAGRVVTIQTPDPGLPDMLGGTFKASDGTVRMITKQLGDVFTLTWPIRSLAAELVAHPTGFAATMYRGCDKSMETCRTVFGNLGNHGGWLIPRTNPMDGRNAY